MIFVQLCSIELLLYCYSHFAKTPLRRNGYCGGIAGVNGVKTGTHVISPMPECNNSIQ